MRQSAALLVVMAQSESRVVMCERTRDVEVIARCVQKVALVGVRTDV